MRLIKLWLRYFDDYDNNPTDAFALKNTASMINSGGSTTNYTFDDCGNMLTEGSSRHFEWSYGDVLRAYRTQSGTSEPTVFTHYLYDAGGVRLKKITRNISGDPTVSVYIDGAFDHSYKVNATSGTRSYEHNDIHVMDDRIRIANLRVGTAFSSDNAPAVRYYLEDHLGNCSFSLETNGSLFSREEYFPFGETSFGSFAKKRYRFCGKERDEESGLYYYGARYYATWTCRFVSVDPLAGEYAFYSPYQYAGNMPINLIDFKGLSPQEIGTQNLPSGELDTAPPATTPNQQGGGAVIYGDNSLKERFKTLLEKHTGYIFTDTNGQLKITGNVADYDPTKYSQELRKSVYDLVNFTKDTIPIYLVSGDNEIPFDSYISGKFDVEDFENLSNPELGSAKIGHIFEERMAMSNPFKYSDIVQDYILNNGHLSTLVERKYYEEFLWAHKREANRKEVAIMNELSKSKIDTKQEIKPLQTRRTDKLGILSTGFRYGNVIYFIFFKGTDFMAQTGPIIGTRKGTTSEITKNYSNDIIKYYLDNTSK